MECDVRNEYRPHHCERNLLRPLSAIVRDIRLQQVYQCCRTEAGFRRASSGEHEGGAHLQPYRTYHDQRRPLHERQRVAHPCSDLMCLSPNAMKIPLRFHTICEYYVRIRIHLSH